MGDAKRIEVKPISRQDADRVIRALHYSGKVVNNSQVHFGVFLDGRCGGALQFGPPIRKSAALSTVAGTSWNEMLELSRMALADWLPRNGESRSLAYALRLLKQNYKHLQWVQTFADATQCGDGLIYRASGWSLLQVNKNTHMWQLPSGDVECDLSFRPGAGQKTSQGAASFLRSRGAVPLPGFQLRYIYFLDPTAQDRLTVPILPYSAIEAAGAGMYKGQPTRGKSDTSDTPAIHAGEGGYASDA